MLNDQERDELRAVQALRLETLHKDVTEIKSALNDLTRAITKLALIEERQLQAAASLDRAFTALDRLEKRIQRLETLAPLNAQASKWVFGGVWAIVGAVFVIAAKKAGLL